MRARAVTLAVCALALARCVAAQTSVTPNVTTRAVDRFGTRPSARAGAASCRTRDGRLFAHGGREGANDRDDAWELDLRRVSGSADARVGNWTRVWAGGADGPRARSGACAAEVGDGIYVFGGVVREVGDVDELWAFDRVNGEWSEVVPADGRRPPRRAGASCAARDGANSTALVVFGGGRRNDVWEFDTQTMLWTEMWANDVVTSASVSGAARAAAFALGVALAAYA